MANRLTPRQAARLMRAQTRQAIENLEANRFTLHIPLLEDLWRYRPGFHHHRAPEFFLQLRGKNEVSFPHERVTQEPGEMLIVPAGVPHSERHLADHGVFRHMVVMLGSDRVRAHIASRTRGERMWQLDYIEMIPESRPEELRRLLGYSALSHADGGAASASATKGLMLAFLALLLNGLGEIPKKCASAKDCCQELNYKIIEVQKFVSDNLACRSLSVANLAEVVQCNPNYLSRLFYRETRERLGAFVNRKRLEHAKELLVTSTLNVSEVAWKCGYVDPDYFSRVFKKTFHVTPTTFRRLKSL